MNRYVIESELDKNRLNQPVELTAPSLADLRLTCSLRRKAKRKPEPRMKRIAVLHLSDLHICLQNKAYVRDSLNALIPFVKVHLSTVDTLLPIFSGDITNSGSPEESEIAKSLIEEFMIGMKQEYPPCTKPFFVVGNHDCFFGAPNAMMRERIISTINDSSDELHEPELEVLLKVNENVEAVFAYLSKTTRSTKEKVASFETLEFDDCEIEVQCLNSALCFRLNAPSGSLLVPIPKIRRRALANNKSYIRIAVIHHPFTWLQADNARELRAYLDSTADIVLTGHEHEGGQAERRTSDKPGTIYLEAGLFSGASAPNSSMINLALLDVVTRRANVIVAKRRDGSYRVANQTSDLAFGDHSTEFEGVTRIAPMFKEFLTDPGAHLTHPRRKNLKLNDLFVYPDLKEQKEKGKDSQSARLLSAIEILQGEQVLDPLLLIGPDKCGKTSLAKVAFQNLYENGHCGLFIDCDRLSWFREDESDVTFFDTITREIYSDIGFIQLCERPKVKRFVIIDNFHRTKLNHQGKKRVIERLRFHFGQLIIFGDESLVLEDVTSRGRAGAIYENFRVFQIQEFGHLLRDIMIEKWVLLGAEEIVKPDSLAATKRNFGNILSSLLGRSLIPSFPLFLLTLLQQMEAATPTKLVNGAYGYFYEFLITRALGSTSSADDLDLKFNYISEIARSMFKDGRTSMSESELESHHQEYQKTYLLRIDKNSLVSSLVQSSVLVTDEMAAIRFKYRYNYYYFVAHWFSRNLEREEIRKELVALCSRLDDENCANILIFLSYLSNEPWIIQTVIEEARKLFFDGAECELMSEVARLGELQDRVPFIVSNLCDGVDSRRDALERMDSDGTANEYEREAAQFEELLKITKSHRIVEVLGQMLKNYAGSMRADRKLAIAKECFALTLRTINHYLNILDNNLSNIITYLVNKMSEDDRNIDKNELTSRARSMLFSVTQMWTFGNFKRLSHACGSHRLEPIYDQLVKESNTFSMKFADVTIRLDHFERFPENDVNALYDESKRNFFAETLVKRLIASHFYMFPVDYRIRDRVCSNLDIKIDQGRAISGRSKRLR